LGCIDGRWPGAGLLFGLGAGEGVELGCSVCILGHYVFVRCLVDIVVALILKHANKNRLGAIGTGTGKAIVVLDNHCDGLSAE